MSWTNSKRSILPTKYEEGGTSLHTAVDLATVKMFIRSGEFDVRATDQFGYTPLHDAAEFTNNPAIIHALVQGPHGLDVLNTRHVNGRAECIRLLTDYNNTH